MSKCAAFVIHNQAPKIELTIKNIDKGWQRVVMNANVICGN